MKHYIRPVPFCDISAPEDAFILAGGWCRFSYVEILERGRAPVVLPAHELTASELAPLLAPRADFAKMSLDQPRIMGILNVTPDSFSDGGLFLNPQAAMMAARSMAPEADIIDVGGESTRPGAQEVSLEQEIKRTIPIISAMHEAGIERPISIDTRKAMVAQEALKARALIVNDVSAMTYDPDMMGVVCQNQALVVLMHSLSTPDKMQDNPQYDDVLLDVYDALKERVDKALASGITRKQIAVDPGIGFGKTLEHNLALLARLSLFHSLGVPVLLGASRKRFIGTISGVEEASLRVPGSIAVALSGLMHGAQIVRVHDVSQTRQAFCLWRAATLNMV